MVSFFSKILVLAFCLWAWPAAAGQVPLAPNATHEDCFDLPPGKQINYNFSSQTFLNFNIHYHEGAAIHYLAEEKWVNEREGYTVTPVEQTYCLMWTNLSPAQAMLDYNYNVIDPEMPVSEVTVIAPVAEQYGPFLPEN